MSTAPGVRLFLRNSSLNLIGQALPLIVAVVSIPILIRELGTERFGFLSVALVMIGYFGLFDLGLGRALTQVIASRLGTASASQLRSLAWTTLGTMFLLGTAAAVLLALGSSWIVADLLRVSPDLHDDGAAAILALSVSIPFVMVSSGTSGLLAAHQRFDLINGVNIPTGALSFIAPLFALWIHDSLFAAVVAIASVRLVATAAFMAIAIRDLPYLQSGKIDHASLMPLLRLGGWMTISNIVSPIMVYTDRILIAGVVSVSAVAYYATPYELATKLWIIPTAVVGALFPAIAHLYSRDSEHARVLFCAAGTLMYFAVTPLVLLLVTFAPEILELWLGSEFSLHGVPVLRWLACGLLLNSLAQVAFAGIQSAGRPDVTAKIHLLELPFYLLALFWCLQTWGITGAAIAWTARVGVDTVLLFRFARRHFPAPRSEQWRNAMSVSGVLLILLLLSNLESLGFRLGVLLVALAGLAGTGWARGIRKRNESRGDLFAGRSSAIPVSN